MERSTSGAKEKTIAVLDGILTVALTLFIFCFVLYPVVTTVSTPNSTKHSPMYLKQYVDEFQWYDESPADTDKAGNKANDEHALNIAVLAITGIFGIISVLAAVTLYMSINPRNSPERKLQMTRYWMHCNLFTIIMAVTELLAVIMFSNYPVQISLPILVYIGFRVIATFEIKNTLRVLSPELVATVDPSVAEEKRVRGQQIGKLSWYQRGRTFNYSGSLAPRLEMQLAPYRGDGISAPSCQCIAPQKE